MINVSLTGRHQETAPKAKEQASHVPNTKAGPSSAVLNMHGHRGRIAANLKIPIPDINMGPRDRSSLRVKNSNAASNTLTTKKDSMTLPNGVVMGQRGYIIRYAVNFSQLTTEVQEFLLSIPERVDAQSFHYMDPGSEMGRSVRLKQSTGGTPNILLQFQNTISRGLRQTIAKILRAAERKLQMPPVTMWTVEKKNGPDMETQQFKKKYPTQEDHISIWLVENQEVRARDLHVVKPAHLPAMEHYKTVEKAYLDREPTMDIVFSELKRKRTEEAKKRQDKKMRVGNLQKRFKTVQGKVMFAGETRPTTHEMSPSPSQSENEEEEESQPTSQPSRSTPSSPDPTSNDQTSGSPKEKEPQDPPTSTSTTGTTSTSSSSANQTISREQLVSFVETLISWTRNGSELLTRFVENL